MKKIILAVMVLSSSVFADYIPDRRDRNMENLCRAIVSNQTDTYKAENDIFYYGLMFGAVDMAILAHRSAKREYVSSSTSDIVHFVCKKTMQDKDIESVGFRRTFNLNAFFLTIR